MLGGEFVDGDVDTCFLFDVRDVDVCWLFDLGSVLGRGSAGAGVPSSLHCRPISSCVRRGLDVSRMAILLELSQDDRRTELLGATGVLHDASRVRKLVSARQEVASRSLDVPQSGVIRRSARFVEQVLGVLHEGIADDGPRRPARGSQHVSENRSHKLKSRVPSRGLLAPLGRFGIVEGSTCGVEAESGDGELAASGLQECFRELDTFLGATLG